MRVENDCVVLNVYLFLIDYEIDQIMFKVSELFTLDCVLVKIKKKEKGLINYISIHWILYNYLHLKNKYLTYLENKTKVRDSIYF